VRTHDGLELHVSTHGPEDAAVTVVLAHCWTADEADWHYQVRDLLTRFGHEVRIVTWDHRGHGRSQVCAAGACTIDNLARDMGEVIDRHAPAGRLVLAGHSIGGMAMTALPTARPDLLPRIAGLLFVSTSSGRLDTVTLGLPEMGRFLRAQIPRMLATRARMLSRGTRRNSPTLERQVAQRFLFGRPARPRDIGLVVDQMTSCRAETFAGYYRDMMLHERTHALTAYDGIPTTVLVGSADLLTPPPHGRRIAANIRGARLVVAPDAGHMLPLERPRLVSNELIDLVETAARTDQAATVLR
jgi:pimeloyl-ACP methyl ester carboxylesterase